MAHLRKICTLALIVSTLFTHAQCMRVHYADGWTEQIDVDMYGNEDEVGRAVRQAIADGICKREDVTVITKIYPGSQFANPEQAIQERIDKLNIDYVDIMLLHHPGDNDVKAYKAMEKQVETGRPCGGHSWQQQSCPYSREHRHFRFHTY